MGKTDCAQEAGMPHFLLGKIDAALANAPR